MRKRRKHSRCLNCDEPLERKDNFCANCGQENTDHQVSLGLLLREFTSNFFSLDSRFAHTIVPFLVKPGKITKAFIEGKRVYYANPIRWYIVISIFHFFFMAKMFQPTVKDLKERSFASNKVELSEVKFDSLNAIPDTTGAWPFSNSQRELFNHLIENTSLTDNEIYDTMKLDRSRFSEYATKKSIRIARETKASLKSYLLKQIPLIIFFILPLYAFYLKLFFWRKGLYIKHLIHSLHLHSFYFFLMGWVWIIALLFEDFEYVGIPASAVITFIYAVISFKQVYGVKIRWSIFRALCIGFLYLVTVSLSLFVGVVISLALL